jgi:hypothetical protein
MVIKKKAFWDKKNPNKKSKPLTPALNVEAGKTTPAEYLDLQGICNELAGTTGLAAPAALRTISS